MSIVLEQLTKRYDGLPVVNRVALEVADGEFFVLLGASGSGKSTILRLIAGLATVDEGRMLLKGRNVTHLPPQQRGVGFVFQHYALFRHMSVADNIEFGLRVRKMGGAERRRRRDELLELVGLAGLGGRMPRQLSGGQQQRVALARALAYRPEVLLLDEPFGALDAKIRVELRRTLRHIQRELGMTTIFVTHDQEEAFELADRLGVMNFGRLLEVGRPEELYQRPQTEYTATFLGTANLLVGQITARGVELGPIHFPLKTESTNGETGQRIQVLFRPEDVVLAASPELLPSPSLGPAVVEQSIFVGAFQRLRLQLPPIPGVRPIAPPVPFGGDFVLVEASRTAEQASQFPLRPGDRAWVGIRRIHALTHPGMSFLFPTDGSPAMQAVLAIGGRIARLANARTTLLGVGSPGNGKTSDLQQHLQGARELLGSGLPRLDTRIDLEQPVAAVRHEVERLPYDLVMVSARSAADVELAGQLLQFGDHHLLLVSDAPAALRRVLICVTPGEPGKEDIQFAGRLIRHLGSTATLLSVLPPQETRPLAQTNAERFLEAGVRTLALLGVSAQTMVRTGDVRTEISRELTAGGYDLLVVGAPLSNGEGQGALGGVVGELFSTTIQALVLVVRSAHTTEHALRARFDTRVSSYTEVIR